MIDWNRVEELRSEVGAEDFMEVVDLFLEEVDEVIERLGHQSGTDHLEQDLHFLKGSSLNLGFATFSSLCRDGEQAARTGQGTVIDLSQILTTYQSSRTEFLAKLAS